jgi:hypothetical protein
MKKLIIAAAMASVMGYASARDITVYGGHNHSTGQEFVGVGMDFPTKDLTFGVAADRSTVGTVNMNRAMVTGTKQIWSVKNLNVGVKVGGAYLNPSKGDNGVAALFGLSMQYPLTKSVSLTGDYVYQYGQGRVEQFNGNTFVLGAKVKF